MTDSEQRSAQHKGNWPICEKRASLTQEEEEALLNHFKPHLWFLTSRVQAQIISRVHQQPPLHIKSQLLPALTPRGLLGSTWIAWSSDFPFLLHHHCDKVQNPSKCKLPVTEPAASNCPQVGPHDPTDLRLDGASCGSSPLTSKQSPPHTYEICAARGKHPSFQVSLKAFSVQAVTRPQKARQQHEPRGDAAHVELVFALL